MKIQYIAVIFIVIMIPIVMVSSYYIQTQIDTITLQTNYTTKLTSSTYDAVKAYQINTVNNRYSSVSDSKIRDVEAAVSTFYNSLSNNEESSKQELRDYVPALLFTLYDGYYIESKYDNVYPKNDGQVIKEQDSETNYGLKPYIYYSCRYIRGNKDFVVNYTLDNAITIYGDLGDGYETLSGYLVNPNLVQIIKEDSNNVVDNYLTYNGIDIKPEILTEHITYLLPNTSKAEEGDYEYIVYSGKKIYRDVSNGKYFWYDNYQKTYINDVNTNNYAAKRTKNNHLYSTSAFDYFKEAKVFSEKIVAKIGTITQTDAVDQQGNKIPIVGSEEDKIGFTVNTGTEPIFNASTNNDPFTSGSTFNENRMAVIRLSITTNLKAAIGNFSIYNGNNYEFALPIMDETDWQKITSNVSMVSFLQGIPIGHKYYNNYCVITNDNNEEVVTQNGIYIVTKNSSNGLEYHLPGCTKLFEDKNLEIQGAYSILSFLRQTVRISEGNYLYFYPQMRGTGENKTYITGCYYCQVNASQTYSIDEIINGKVTGKDANWEDVIVYTTTNERFNQIRAQYFTALARERYDLYNSNMESFNTENKK